MIKVTNLIKTYGDRTVLNIPSLTVNKGETLVVVGPNGSGKSTLLKIIAGVIEKNHGEISVNGEVYYLPQKNIPFRKKVRDNILFSAEYIAEKEKRCDKILESLGLEALADKNASKLSGGECQRLCLGRILINSGDFLLLDEPSSAADIEGTELIEKAIREYKNKTGCGIIMTTHSPRQAKDLADTIIMLRNGEIAEEGSPDELLSHPKTQWGKKFIDSWKID